MMENGMDSEMIRVLEKLRRKRIMIRMASRDPPMASVCRVLTDSRMNSAESKAVDSLMSDGICFCISLILAWILLLTATVLEPDCFWMTRATERCPLSLVSVSISVKLSSTLAISRR